MYAATIRHHDGEFFVICQYLNAPEGNIGVIFKSSDPYSNVAWSDPVRFKPSNIDPDLFWDNDGKVYSVMAGITLQEIDLGTGDLSQPPLSVWNGTGGTYPEGPHLYKKDDWYYLMIAEGATLITLSSLLEARTTISRLSAMETSSKTKRAIGGECASPHVLVQTGASILWDERRYSSQQRGTRMNGQYCNA
ncbi:hypothetical protein TsFJ059_007998 [Trichoderma semiorbis]|uniref:Uncharacterized protein n=1 Tax=Trichoderma semiorbis TaxID=1491008 RepID=A0A9P8KR08_9HYPO|nr:hypothetical protein TsFJ059_007998 [Trichoderma semiorbis]